MVNLDASAPTHFLLSWCFSQLHHLIYQKQLCWPATHSTHLFSVVRLLYITPINLITLYHPKASLLSLFTSFSPGQCLHYILQAVCMGIPQEQGHETHGCLWWSLMNRQHLLFWLQQPRRRCFSSIFPRFALSAYSSFQTERQAD